MDFESLKSQATTIRDERERSANSATRVGRAMLETVNAVEENNTAIVAANANIATNAANIATAKANIASNTADIQKLQDFYHGDLGNHSSWADAQSRLDRMVTDGSVSGLYMISVGAVPFTVHHTCVNATSNLFTQTVEGPAFINSQTGTLQTASSVAINLFSRTYAEGAWGAWVRLAAMSDVPTVQQGSDGTTSNYIYQKKSDPTLNVLCGVGKFFQNENLLKLRLKIWGSGNRNYNDGLYCTYNCPTVTSGADGAMDHNVYGRLMNNTIYAACGASSVTFHYTDLANGGSKSATITAATTAAAGCMTVAHVNALNSLSSHIVDLGDFVNEEEALRRLGTLGTCNDKKLVHAHLTYSTTNGGSTKNTLILIQSIHDNYCRQFIFNKDKVLQRGITFADDSLTQITLTEDWAYLFGDRLEWNESSHGYVLSQFGQTYGHSMCDPIPMASATADGLMSKEDYQLLQKIKAKLNL